MVCRYDFQFHGHLKNERFLKFKKNLRQIFLLSNQLQVQDFKMTDSFKIDALRSIEPYLEFD